MTVVSTRMDPGNPGKHKATQYKALGLPGVLYFMGRPIFGNTGLSMMRPVYYQILERGQMALLSSLGSVARELRGTSPLPTHLKHLTFKPLACEVTGVWNAEAEPEEFFNCLDSRISGATGDAPETTFLYQRLSIALQKGNAVCIGRSAHNFDWLEYNVILKLNNVIASLLRPVNSLNLCTHH